MPARPAESFRRWSVVGYGLVLFAGSVGHLVSGRELLFSTYLEITVPAAVSLGVVYLGWSTTRDGVPSDGVVTILRWSVGGGVCVTLVALLVYAIQFLNGVRLAEPEIVLLSAIAVGSVVGGVLGVHDYRLRHRTTQLVEQQNRLETFASIVAHDLRNPLNVAQGRVELAREHTGEEFHQVSNALSRMERLLDEILVTARDGPSISGMDRLSLANVARQVWEELDGADGSATLEIASDREIEAETLRLELLFEHLFRNAVEHGSTSPRSHAHENAVEHGSTNPPSRPGAAQEDAIEHGGPDVTITVGLLDTGFYVEDDGPGVEEHLHERVFEGGFTTSEEGRGLGLSIVRTIADAHGWSHRLTTGESGGARVEFTDVFEP